LIALINLGNSNIQSVINALEYLRIDFVVTNEMNEICNCSRIILPGVGTFASGMKRLEELNLTECLREEVLVNKKPILGICLGMQLLFETSEESKNVKGLNILDGKVVSLPISKNYKIPRIGWAESRLNQDFLSLKKHSIIDFYYIHSYYVLPKDKNIITIMTDDNITSAIESDNIYACQFHPEKSHTNGLNILRNFAKLEG